MTIWLLSLALETALALLISRGYARWWCWFLFVSERWPVEALYLGVAKLDHDSRHLIIDRVEKRNEDTEPPYPWAYSAFRRFLWADILCQLAAIAARASWGMAGYIPVEIAAEIITGVLFGFVVAESWRRLVVSNGPAKLILISAAVAIPAHLILAEPAWAPIGSLLLWSVALSHSIMGILLALIQFTARKWRWHESILAGWMLGTAVLFYAAPRFAVGYSVLWLNAGTWAALIAASMASRRPGASLPKPSPSL